MAQTKEERLKKVHANALLSFDRIQGALRDERIQCLEDRRFYSLAGAQWEGPLTDQFSNSPRMEVNKIHLSIIRIFNEYRNNRIDAKFISKDGTDKEDLADTCAMLYRADEQDSVAEEAYDNAFEEAVGGGFGAWRLRTCYEDESDEDDERQRIRFEPIFDADSSVFFDLDAKRQDKSDAKECFVLTAMSREGFEEEWGEIPPASVSKEIHQYEFDWLTPDVIYIAEYYRVEEKTEVLHIYRGLDGSERKVLDAELKEDEDLERVLEVTGFREVRQKKLRKKKIHKYLLSGDRVLDDCGYIAGECIPVIPVYGKRWFIDNIERCMGHVRLAKDSQRLKNMQLSKLAEISSLSSVQKAILTPEQVAGHEYMWEQDNIKNYPYLLVNPITDAMGNATAIGPTAYTQVPNIPPAMAALLQITEQDMKDVLGNQQMGEQISANMSGKAVELVQNRLDMQTYIYVSNFAKAVKRSGEVWLSMMKEVAVEEGRTMKGITEQGDVQPITLLVPVMREDGATGYDNDLSEATFDIAVEVGPSSDSKKQATVRALTGMMQVTQDPETMQVLSAMAIMNIEGEGVKDVRDFFRQKLLRMGAIKPTDEEAQQMQAEQANRPPDPNTQFLQASAEQAQAQAAKARADTILTVAKSKESQAKTAEILAGIDRDDQEQVFKTLDAVNQQQDQHMKIVTHDQQMLQNKRAFDAGETPAE